LYTHLTAVLFTIDKFWKLPRCPTTDEWIIKIWYIYKMEFYSATKRNHVVSRKINGTGELHVKQSKPSLMYY
jgi:hypothetical protein